MPTRLYALGGGITTIAAISSTGGDERTFRESTGGDKMKIDLGEL